MLQNTYLEQVVPQLENILLAVVDLFNAMEVLGFELP